MTLKSKVERLLIENPKLRDSDLALLGAFWEKEGFIMTPEQKKKFMQLTIAESITRARRELRGQYPGKPEVEEGRYKKYVEYVDEYSGRTSMRYMGK